MNFDISEVQKGIVEDFEEIKRKKISIFNSDNKPKIYSFDNEDWVIASSEEEAIKFYKDETGVDVEDWGMDIDECNYDDITNQDISILKGILPEKVIENISDFIENNKDFKVNGSGYEFKYFRSSDYVAVRLKFKQIIEDEKILNNIEIPSLIATINI